MIVQKRSRVSNFNTARHSSFSNENGEATYLRIEALFQPDILIPSQYQATCRSRFHLEPERVLMLAVLEDAVVCFQNHLTATRPKARALFHEAEEWILAEDKSYPFSFENICDALGFDPVYLRQGLLRWKEAILIKPNGRKGHKKLAS